MDLDNDKRLTGLHKLKRLPNFLTELVIEVQVFEFLFTL